MTGRKGTIGKYDKRGWKRKKMGGKTIKTDMKRNG